jgi:hypothetical protein
MTLKLSIQKAKPQWLKFRIVCRFVWQSQSPESAARPAPDMVAVSASVYSSSDASSRLSSADSASSGTSQLRRIS